VIIFYGVKEFPIEAWRALRDELDPQRRVLWMATVMPGYDDTRLGRTAQDNFAVDRQDGADYLRVWQGAIATRPEMIMITSWNEWLEGSQIEPSVSYGDLYLRLTRQMVEEYHRAIGLAPALSTPSTGAFFAEVGGGQGGIPRLVRDDGSQGDWQRAREIRLRWLTDAAILQVYMTPGSVDAAIERYGLPMSRPERRGPFVVQRFQHIAFQHWVEEVPGMPPRGSVTPVLAGKLVKQLGMIPPEATRPASP
jgi:hypothetical protein